MTAVTSDKRSCSSAERMLPFLVVCLHIRSERERTSDCAGQRTINGREKERRAKKTNDGERKDGEREMKICSSACLMQHEQKSTQSQ